MANVTTLEPRNQEIDLAEGAITDDIGIETDAIEPKPAETNRGGRPKKKDDKKKGSAPADPPFFAKVAAIPPEEWGVRAFIYCYCTEPICNLKILGESKYLFRSGEPIRDLDGIMKDYGSFKGYLTLNFRKAGDNGTDAIDRLDFEIYNPKYPPKIPRKAWLADPRNERWVALLPPEAPAPGTPGAAPSLMEAANFYRSVRTELKEEMPQTSGTAREVIETLRAAREFVTPAAAPAAAPAAPAVDPFTAAMGIAKELLQIRAENPMVDFLRDQMNRQHEEMKELRKELAEARKPVTAAVQQKSWIDQLFELAGDDTKMERVTKVLGRFGFSLEGGGRPSKVTGFEMVRDILNSPFGAQIGGGLGQLLLSLAGGTPGAPTPQLNPAVPAAAAPGTERTTENDEARIQRIATTITNPMINEYLLKDEDGETFAAWVIDAWPDDFAFLQKLGAPAIIGLYERHNRQLWEYLQQQNKLDQFRKFVAEFCAFKPDTGEAGEPGEPGADSDTIEEFEPKGATTA